MNPFKIAINALLGLALVLLSPFAALASVENAMNCGFVDKVERDTGDTKEYDLYPALFFETDDDECYMFTAFSVFPDLYYLYFAHNKQELYLDCHALFEGETIFGNLSGIEFQIHRFELDDLPEDVRAVVSECMLYQSDFTPSVVGAKVSVHCRSLNTGIPPYVANGMIGAVKHSTYNTRFSPHPMPYHVVASEANNCPPLSWVTQRVKPDSVLRLRVYGVTFDRNHFKYGNCFIDIGAIMMMVKERLHPYGEGLYMPEFTNTALIAKLKNDLIPEAKEKPHGLVTGTTGFLHIDWEVEDEHSYPENTTGKRAIVGCLFKYKGSVFMAVSESEADLMQDSSTINVIDNGVIQDFTLQESFCTKTSRSLPNNLHVYRQLEDNFPLPLEHVAKELLPAKEKSDPWIAVSIPSRYFKRKVEESIVAYKPKARPDAVASVVPNNAIKQQIPLPALVFPTADRAELVGILSTSNDELALCTLEELAASLDEMLQKPCE